ncbi:MAG: HAD-IIIC family phosphatase [Oscillospiraceae bacterium]|nr:HAD-IIIC family phosphatase [Oscillospiraceae bacterium]
MNILSYPFDGDYILKHKKAVKKQLLSENTGRIKIKIAVLGGSTTNEIVNIMELFLLSYGLEPDFYQSEYAQYWQDAVFSSQTLDDFHPDLIYIHTTNRNITEFKADMTLSQEQTDEAVMRQFRHFEEAWTALSDRFGCPIIQNNFEMPFYRLLGNKDSTDHRGRLNFINRLNVMFAEYASSHKNFYINDINYVSACFGLDRWSDMQVWYMYKYALAISAIPELAFNTANIIKSIYGKNKKMLVLDLDNTLWGGVIGDNGVNGIEIGHETGMAEAYTGFQEYIKEHKQLGVLLAVNSKNDRENALSGLRHPDTVLTEDDFVTIKANWNNKDDNILEIASDVSILPESFVFADDNPAERAIVASQVSGVSTPELDTVENYIKILDRNSYFELTSYTADDVKRNDMYKANLQRLQSMKKFSDYNEYLLSLDMKAQISDFEPVYLERIVQLTNKSNQFNLTTKRYTMAEMSDTFESPDYIRLFGKLTDKYGDNGIVSVVIGEIKNTQLHIDLWLMSCRVLKRNMEYAMLDELISQCSKRGISEVYGYYYKTAKNSMVENLYGDFGFMQTENNEDGSRVFRLCTDDYMGKNKVIKVNDNGGN